MKTDVLFVTVPLYLVSYLNQKDLYLSYRYMTSMLRSKGYGAEILYPQVPADFPPDIYFCTDDEAASRRLMPELMECLAAQIVNIDCKVLGFSPNIANLEFTIQLVEKLRRDGLDSHVVFGGHLATFSHERLLSKYDCLDSVVRGEGEYTIVELIRRIDEGKPLDGICGLAYRNGNEIVVNPPGQLVPDLDALPFPATDHLGGLIRGSGDRPFWMRICCSRGCYGNCSFCSVREFYNRSPGKIWRARTPKSVIAEVEVLNREYGVDHFVLGGDSFWCGSEKRKSKYANQIAQEIISRGLDIKFKVSSRSNDIHESTLSTLIRAGLTDVEIGIESSSQRALDTFNKGTTVEQNETALELLRKLGLRTYIDFIFYDPYLTLREARLNHAFQERYWSEHVAIAMYKKLILAEGFPVTDALRKDGLLRGDFPIYDFEFVDPRIGALESIHRRVWKSGHHLLSTLPPSMGASFYGIVPDNENSRRMKPFLSALSRRFESLRIQYYDRMLSIVELAGDNDMANTVRLLEQETEPWCKEIAEARSSLKAIHQHLGEVSRVCAA